MHLAPVRRSNTSGGISPGLVDFSRFSCEVLQVFQGLWRRSHQRIPSSPSSSSSYIHRYRMPHSPVNRPFVLRTEEFVYIKRFWSMLRHHIFGVKRELCHSLDWVRSVVYKYCMYIPGVGKLIFISTARAVTIRSSSMCLRTSSSSSSSSGNNYKIKDG